MALGLLLDLRRLVGTGGGGTGGFYTARAVKDRLASTSATVSRSVARGALAAAVADLAGISRLVFLRAAVSGGGGGGGAGNYNGALGASGRVVIEYYTV